MKIFYLLTLSIIGFNVCIGQKNDAFINWSLESRSDNRLLPMYGHEKKSKSQTKADDELIARVLEEEKTNLAGSEHLIKLGFHYLYKGDIKTAMYRFNQSWLLDSTNANVFWGFGGVYFYLSAYNEALEMYKMGLQLDSLNTNLLTNIGAIYLTMFNNDKSKNEILKKSISYLKASYQLNPKYSSTVYKLIIC